MKNRRLGNTGLQVSVVGLGTWAMGGDEWGPSEDAESIRVIRRALELGITLIDTADVYGKGHSEELIRSAIGDRSDIHIVSKAGWDIYSDPGIAGGGGQNFEPSYLDHALERSMQRLGRRQLDVYLLHDPSLEVITGGVAFNVLRRLKATGRVRAIGISVGNEEEALAALAAGAEVIELPFNALRSWARERVLPMAYDGGVGIIAREPLERGLLSGKYSAGATFAPGDHRGGKGQPWIAKALPKISAVQDISRTVNLSPAQVALAFVLAHDGVSTVIPGARTVAQVEQNAAAAELALGDDVVAALVS